VINISQKCKIQQSTPASQNICSVKLMLSRQSLVAMCAWPWGIKTSENIVYYRQIRGS